MRKNILVVAAHPDDEVLGCGGAIIRHVQAGDSVHVHIMAEGLTSRSPQRASFKQDDQLKRLADCAEAVSQMMGVQSLQLHPFPDNRMDSLELLDIVKVVEAMIDEVKPDVVYMHHAGDVNIDHQLTHQAVLTACRPIPGAGVNTLLFFETPSSTEWNFSGIGAAFSPNWFVDISDTLQLKLAALAVYEQEMRAWPHPRSLKAVELLAGWRGSTIGVAAAEAFCVGRNIVK